MSFLFDPPEKYLCLNAKETKLLNDRIFLPATSLKYKELINLDLGVNVLFTLRFLKNEWSVIFNRQKFEERIQNFNRAGNASFSLHLQAEIPDTLGKGRQ